MDGDLGKNISIQWITQYFLSAKNLFMQCKGTPGGGALMQFSGIMAKYRDDLTLKSILKGRS